MGLFYRRGNIVEKAGSISRKEKMNYTSTLEFFNFCFNIFFIHYYDLLKKISGKRKIFLFTNIYFESLSTTSYSFINTTVLFDVTKLKTISFEIKLFQITLHYIT